MRWVFLLLMVTSSLALADNTELSYDRIHFSEQASAEVENDVLVAVMAVQREGLRTDSLADQVNRTMDEAIKLAKQAADVKVQTLAYRTSPTYRDGQIRGWQVTQELRLESKDSQALSQLIGNLQSILNLQSLDYQISSEQRRAHEEQLIAQALQRFTQRAESISQQLQRNGYRIVQINIETGGHMQVPMTRQVMMASADMRGAAAPRIEAGEQKLQVSVHAEIELLD